MPSLVRLLVLAGFCVPVRAADLDKLVPTEAGVAVLNVKSLTDSLLFRKHFGPQFKAALNAEQSAKFWKATDFDPLRDLTSITLFAPGNLPQHQARACLQVKGKFHARFQVAVLAAVKMPGSAVEISTKDARTYFTMEHLGQKIVATFVGFDTLALATSIEYLDEVLAGKKVEATSLRTAFANLDGSRTLLAGLGGSKALASIPATTEFADKTESLTATVHLADDLDIGLGANMTDAASAKALAQRIKQSLPVLNLLAAELFKQHKPVIEFVVKNVKISSEGKAVSVRLHLTEHDLLRLWPGAFAWSGSKPPTPDHLTEARAALKAERYADADRALDEVSWYDPRNAEVRAMLEDAVQSRNGTERRWASAALCRVHLAAARMLLQVERFGGAEEEFRAARTCDPQNPEVAAGFQELADRRQAASAARGIAGRAAIEAGDWDEVRRVLARSSGLGRTADDLRTAFVERLIRDLRSPEWAVRRAAVEELGSLGRAAEKAVPALLRALTAAGPEGEVAIRRALERIVP